MEKIKELRMTAIILLVGLFLLSGCLFPSKYEVTFKTNGGSEVKSASVKSGNKVEIPETPTKEGYVFEGWYLNGKEFNFEEELEEDITLVAKWRKVHVDGEESDNNEENNDEEEIDNSTTEPTTEKRTTKKKTTKKSTTASGSVKTTKKTTTTTKKTTTTTSETTTKKVEPTEPVEPIDPVEPIEPTEPVEPVEPVDPVDPVEPVDPVDPEEPTVPEKKELKMNITIIEEEIKTSGANDNNPLLDLNKLDLSNNTNLDLEEEIIKKYHMTIDTNSENVNTESNLSEEDLIHLLESDISSWEIYNNKGSLFTLVFDDKKITFTSDEEIKVLTIKIDENNSYILYFDEENDKWIIDYPRVEVINEDKKMFFNNLEDAISSSNSMSKISLLKDIEITETIVINKDIEIEGNGYKILSTDEYAFKIVNIEEEEKMFLFRNINLDVNNFLNIEEIKVKEILLENVKGTYKGEIIKKLTDVLVTYENCELELVEKTL